VSAPAPASARVLGQARFEAGTLLRNGEQLLVSIVLPLGALIGLAFTSVPSLGEGRRIDVATPGVLALCVISAAFTAQAIATGFDRRASVLRLLGTTPLGRSGLLGGKALATLTVEVVQWCVVGGVGLALGWRPDPAGLGYAVLFLLLGTWAFVALALLLAGTLRAEATLALANLVYLVLLGIGGIIFPLTKFPAAARPVLTLLPSGALSDGLHRVLQHAAGLPVRDLAVLIVWAAVSIALAARLFRWE
jgi:ABC-2 type transport system permease protein